MNHHQRHLPPGVNRALYLLSLLSFTGVFPCAALAMPRLFKANRTVVAPPRGYLSAVGAPELRFQEPLTISDAPLAVPPSSSKPVSPDASTESPATPVTVPAPAATVPVAAEPPAAEIPAEKIPAPKNKPSSVILPDDTRPAVRPEDFLPFFQLPTGEKGTGSVNLVVPVPPQPSGGSPLPASSATYTQSPK